MCNHNDGRAYAQSASGAVRLLPAVPLWYVPYSRTKRIIIALLCMAAPPLGLAFGPRFLKRLQLNIEPPHSSVAYHAETAYQEAFPLQAAGTKDAYILLLSRPGGLPVINASSPQCRIDVFGVEVFAASHCPLAAPVGDFETALETWLTAKIPGWFNDSTLASYARYHAHNYTLLQAALLSQPHTPTASNATIMRIQAPDQLEQGSADSFAFTESLEEQIATLVDAAGGRGALTVHLAGMPAFIRAAQAGVTADMAKMDTISFPLALLVFVCMLRSLRLLLLPVLNIAVVVSAAFALMYPVSLSVSVGSTVPSLMVSVAIAMSIDYSLFLLSRFREEVARGASPTRAVELMMGAAGHTVLISGATLTLCFAGLTGLPIVMLRTMGIGAGWTAAACVLVNLTLTPTCLLTFPTFFADFNAGGCGCVCRALSGKAQVGAAGSVEPLTLASGTGGDSDSLESSVPAPAEPSLNAWAQTGGSPSGGSASAAHGAALTGVRRRRRQRSVQCWARVAGCTQRFSLLTIGLVILAALPFLLKLPKMNITADFALVTPRDAPCSLAYAELVRTFGSGAEAPYQLLLTPRAGANATTASQAFFEDVNALLGWLAVRNATGGGGLLELRWLLSVTGFVPPRWLSGGREKWRPIPYQAYETLQSQHTILARELQMLWAQQVSLVDGNRTMSVSVRLPFDPFSALGSTWLADARRAIDEASAPDSDCACNRTLDVAAIQLAGGGGAILDAIATVYAAMPLVVAVVFGAAFGVVFAAFRSVLVPLRAVLSIALTVGWVYGVLIWVYQEGALAWTGIASLAPTPSGISWLVPVVTFAVLVGLGLDYDVFLLTRVYEIRQAGATNTRAINMGLVKSGNVITAAGLIMSIAFCGLLLNATATLNQLACVLVTSVLLDTFVVRTLLLPAVSTLLGEWNWWPRRMPTPDAPEQPAPLGCSLTCYDIDVEDA